MSPGKPPAEALAALAAFGATMADVCGLEAAIDTALDSIDALLGFRHVLLLMHQTDSDRLITIASRGYDVVGIGSEVTVGQGVIGTVAASRTSMRIGNLQRMLKYARSVSAGEDSAQNREIQLPGLAGARSQVAAPMIADGVLLGVIAAESEQAMAFDESAQIVLTIAGQLVAGALERAEILDRTEAAEQDHASPPAQASAPAPPHPTARPPAQLRHYTTDGSTFIDDEYIIKGVAGRLLWKLATEHILSGRTAFTNREVRLDPALDMPPFRDNFESRLVLLKRRLDERDAPVRITSTGRGRFQVSSHGVVHLGRVDEPAAHNG